MLEYFATASMIAMSFVASNITSMVLEVFCTYVFTLPSEIFPAALNLNSKIPFSEPCVTVPFRVSFLIFSWNFPELSMVRVAPVSPYF